ncbi:TPA: fimbrial protein [Enterobacter cloacae]|nr:fimbrial protein [Enterobacter cloacae]
MFRVVLNVAFIMLLLLSGAAKAWDCGIPFPSTTVTPGDIVVPYNASVGTTLSQVTTPIQNKFLCSDTTVPLTNQSFGIKALGTYDMSINNQRIYKTNINGIGYSISGSTTSCGFKQGAVSGSNTIGGNIDTYMLCQNLNGLINPELNGNWTITFYKTAQDTGSGVVTGAVVGSYAVLGNTLVWWYQEPTVTVSSFNVRSPACKVITPSISVTMGDVDKNAFHGEGTSPGDQYTKTFDIPLTCNAGTNVKIKFDGDAYDATKGVIKTITANNSATGVGIQLLYNNLNIKLGEYIAAGNSSSGGTFMIPMKARYYQTGSIITPGEANGIVTITLTYN